MLLGIQAYAALSVLAYKNALTSELAAPYQPNPLQLMLL